MCLLVAKISSTSAAETSDKSVENGDLLSVNLMWHKNKRMGHPVSIVLTTQLKLI